MSATSAKLLRFAGASLAFCLLLGLVYFLHVRLLPVDVVFYSALADAALSVAIAAAALRWLPAFAGFNGFEKVQMLFAWALLGYMYAISVPTVIDRSLSFYILEKLQQRGGALRLDRFEQVFTQEYAREHQLVQVRVTEQLASGTVTMDGDCVRLTARGQRLASFSRFFREHLLPRRRLLMGRYTDELTLPFRGGGDAADHDCAGAGTASRK